MTPPSVKTRLLGHPVIFIPAMLLAAGSVWLLIQNHNAWPITAVVCVLANIALKANQARAEYLAWKRAWDVMEGTPPSRPARVGFASVLGMAIFCLIIAVGYAHGAPAAIAALVMLMVPILLIAGLRRLWRRTRRHRPRDQNMTVSVCVSGPLMPVPTLNEAYRRLPDYCLRVLGNGD